MSVALFDLDGTLVDRDSGFAAWLDELVRRHGMTDDERRAVQRLDRSTRRRDAFFAALVADHPRLGAADRLWADYRRAMPGLASAFPGVLDGLDRLRAAGWRLGVVTNGEVDNQEGKLAASGIGSRVDGWCVSAELGIRKPDPEIFRAALRRVAEAEPQQVWVVGDDPELDIAGATGCGFRTIWVSHGEMWTGDGPRPDVTVRTPAEAFDQLAATSGVGTP